jgi:cytidylate kinase
MDGIRQRFMTRYFKADPDDFRYYDLIINTGLVSAAEAVSIVSRAVPFKSMDRFGRPKRE